MGGWWGWEGIGVGGEIIMKFDYRCVRGGGGDINSFLRFLRLVLNYFKVSKNLLEIFEIFGIC